MNLLYHKFDKYEVPIVPAFLLVAARDDIVVLGPFITISLISMTESDLLKYCKFDKYPLNPPFSHK